MTAHTITTHELGEHWPDLEKTLAAEGEIIVMDAARPIARITPIAPQPDVKPNRPRFDPAENARWREKMWKNHPPMPSTDETLRLTRYDDLQPPSA
jgi:antitoxin (DNA-binding transcriptional repressor) of toxin-antitoxin stability system